MRALQLQSDCCVHNLNDQMNHKFQGSLSRSSGKTLSYKAESWVQILAGEIELFQKLQNSLYN